MVQPIGEHCIGLEAFALKGAAVRETEHDRGKLRPGCLYRLDAHVRGRFIPSAVESLEEDVQQLPGNAAVLSGWRASMASPP